MKVGIVGCDYSSQMGTGLTEEMKSQIDDGVRHAAYRIIEGKGATYTASGRELPRSCRPSTTTSAGY